MFYEENNFNYCKSGTFGEHSDSQIESITDNK